MGRNGYNPSILDTVAGECYIAKVESITARHEVYFGEKNRENSKHYGFWVNVCPQIHDILHTSGDLDEQLKMECQEKFEETHTHQEFMDIIGRNYL